MREWYAGRCQFSCVYLTWVEILLQNEAQMTSLWELMDNFQASRLWVLCAAEPTQLFKIRYWWNLLTQASYITEYKLCGDNPPHCRDVQHIGCSCLYHALLSFICFIQWVPKTFLSTPVLILTLSIFSKAWLDKVKCWKIHQFPKIVASVVNYLHRHAHASHPVSIWPDWAFKHCIFCAVITEIKKL